MLDIEQIEDIDYQQLQAERAKSRILFETMGDSTTNVLTFQDYNILKC